MKSLITKSPFWAVLDIVPSRNIESYIDQIWKASYLNKVTTYPWTFVTGLGQIIYNDLARSVWSVPIDDILASSAKLNWGHIVDWNGNHWEISSEAELLDTRIREILRDYLYHTTRWCILLDSNIS